MSSQTSPWFRKVSGDASRPAGGTSESRRVLRSIGLSRTAAIVVVAVGLAVLGGWFSDAEGLTGIFPNLATMRPNTAAAFVLLGTSLFLRLPDAGGSPPSRPRRVVATSAAGLALILAGLTLVEHLLAKDIGIDRLILDVPGRMPPQTAAGLLLLGGALIALDVETRRGLPPSQFLVLLAATIAFVALTGYAYRAADFYRIASFTDMALHSSVTFLIASAGILAARPRRGVVRILLSGGPAGTMARRLLPVALLVPVALGWVCLEGQRQGFYGPEVGVGLLVVSTIVSLAVIAYATAYSIEVADAARFRAEESLREQAAVLRSVFENMADGVVVADQTGRFILRNRVADGLVGSAPDDLDPSLWPEAYGVFRTDQVTPFPWEELPLARSIRGESSDDVEMFLRNPSNPDGVFLSVSGRPLPDRSDGLRSGVVVIHDVTAHRRSEEAIRVLNRELEQRVLDRTAQLEAANRELEAFAYSVSHDLRAPLRSIDGFGRILQEDLGGRLGAEADDAIRRIRRATAHMGELIDDLLKLSKVTRAELYPEPIDLSALAREVAAELRRLDPREDVQMIVADGIEARGDRRLLRIALENLIGNSFKFTANTCDARIEFGRAENGSRREYFVRDNGVGFDMAHAGKLFAPFQRLHRTDEFPGTGIGLATVQRIILRHGGTVRAEGSVNGGATFSFTL